MKLPFKLTPRHRFAFAFILGWAFHIAANLGTQLFLDDNLLWIVALICGLVLMFVYSTNVLKFEKEHTWMMLKTGGPKEEFMPSVKNGPLRPPPPPMPPVRKYKGKRKP